MADLKLQPELEIIILSMTVLKQQLRILKK